MPFINLIEEQRLAARRQEAKARSFFFLFVFAAVASVGGYGGLLIKSESLQGEQKHIEARLEKLTPLVEAIEENQNKKSVLEPRLRTLEDAQVVTARWDRILGDLSHQTPHGVWLTAIRCNASDPLQPIAVDFYGMANGQDPVSEFTLRMQNCTDLEGVDVTYTQEKLVGDLKGTEFQVHGNIVGTAAPKPKLEEEETK